MLPEKHALPCHSCGELMVESVREMETKGRINASDFRSLQSAEPLDGQPIKCASCSQGVSIQYFSDLNNWIPN